MHDDVHGACGDGALRTRAHRDHVGPPLVRSSARKRGTRRSERAGFRQYASQRRFDSFCSRLEENAIPILGRDQLRHSANVARDERDAVLEALVDGVGGVVLERRHDGQRPGAAQPCECVVLVEFRLERHATERALRRLGKE